MSDESDLKQALIEIWGVDSDLKDLRDAESSAAVHLTRSIRWLDAQPKRQHELETARAAEQNLRKLASMASNLEQAYVANVLSLDREADISVSLEKTNTWLAWCYFTIGISKALDAVAQFYGGKTAKLITDLKTPATDIGKSLAGSKGASTAISDAQTANLINKALGDLGNNFFSDLQKIGSCTVEIYKDVAEFSKAFATMGTLKSADLKLFAAKGATTTAKALDLVNRLLTLSEVGLRRLPTSVTGRVPDFVTERIGNKAWFDRTKAILSAVKYSIEAVESFYQCCRSIGDLLESAEAKSAASERIEQQLFHSTAGVFSADRLVFAGATSADLIRMVSHLNSAPDAHDMAHIAIAQVRTLKLEIEKMAGECDKNGRWHGFDLRRVAEIKARLLKRDGNLSVLRTGLERAAPTASVYDGGQVTRDQMLLRIDDARGKVARAAGPYVPTWTAPKGRFGPRYGTI